MLGRARESTVSRKQGPQHALAIVGMACWYPGAQSLSEFWENILAKRQQFRRMPDQRLPLDQYHHPDKHTPDKTYGTEAAVLDGFEFDWKGRRIPKQVFESTDIVHWLALDVALKALDDSGLDLQRLQSLQTGVVLGNTLTGEWTRTNAMRMRWPYIERVLQETAQQKGLSGEAFNAYTKVVEEAFKSVFPAPNEDTLAGALSNTIAGRICNFLDLHGGGYTVDGACSSSLLAVITAARSLISGDLDVAFAGGIDISLDTFELIGFAKTGALTPDEMRVYDKRANGFIPGEGCGFVVLKRLADAERDGDRIYAVLNGWGISSDGKGGITAPSIHGQAAAIGKAYAMAGYGIESCAFIEGHGTGTTVGDRVEISGLTEVLGTKVPERPIALTSLKSIVGHTKAAAGIGAFIKTAIAVNQRVIPPMAGVEEPNLIFQDKARWFYPAIDGRLCDPKQNIRAGVSAMGFGGINTHTTLESYGQPAEHLQSFLADSLLLSSHDRSEILIFSASSQAQLKKKVETTLRSVRKISRAELTDLAADLARFSQPQDPYRAAIVCQRPEEAFQALQKLTTWLEAPLGTQTSRELKEGQVHITLGHSTKAPKLGFLFPGQGSQKPNMGRKLQERFAWAKDLVARAESSASDLGTKDLLAKASCELWEDREERLKALTDTAYAQPAISLCNALWFEYLQSLGLTPALVGGHSLGELSALYAAKALSFEQLIQLASKRGQLMASPSDKAGSMIFIGADAKTVEAMLTKVSGYAQIANRNASDQTVIAGDPSTLQALLDQAKSKNLRCGPLAVSNAFHSRYMQGAAESFRSWLETITPAPVQIPFVRGTDGQIWQKETALRDYLSQQIVEAVDFIALAETMQQEVDLILEVGTGHVLSNLVRRIPARKGEAKAAFCCESRPGHDADLKSTLAACFVRGARIRWDELYRHRLVRPYLRPDERLFIESPTERTLHFQAGAPVQILSTAGVVAPQVLAPLAAAAVPAPLVQAVSSGPALAAQLPASHRELSVQAISIQASPLPAAAPSSSEPTVEQVLARIVEDLTGFEAATIHPNMKVLDDLNMDSIKASELISNAAMHYGIAGDIEAVGFTNASLGEIAQAIRAKLPEGGVRSPKLQPEGPSQQALQVDRNAAPMLPPSQPKLVARPTLATEPQLQKTHTPPPQNATVMEPSAKQPKVAEISKAKLLTPWVRNFSESFVPFVQKVPQDLTAWQGLKLVLIAHISDEIYIQSLAEALHGLAQTVQVQCLDGHEDKKRLDLGSADTSLVLLPRESEILEDHVQLLSTIAQTRWPRQHRLIFLQCDDGLFGHSKTSTSSFSTKAFAQSLAQERSDLKIQSCSIAAELAAEPQSVLSRIAHTWTQTKAPLVQAFAHDGHILSPQWVLDQPLGYESRQLTWHPDDVVLVTGGAKGITAACALKVAEHLKVKMALVGSSPLSPEDAHNPEHPIGATLAAFANAGLSARYYACDITKSSSVSQLLQDIEHDLGKIRALVHGAGSNQPRPAATVSTVEALKEMGPKVRGIQNLLAAINPAHLQLIVGLSSVIGVVGMPGNAWYGFANECLDLTLRRYQSQHPHVQTQTLAYSVWAELGMGARMGSDKNLADKGISSITPEEGIQRFLGLFLGKSQDQQTIISSRMSRVLPTPSTATYAIAFADSILHYQADVEVIAHTHVTTEGHPYLKDHNYKGALLMPTVYGLEAMAQVVDRLVPLSRYDSLHLEDIKLTRPITVGPQGCTLEIYAERLEDQIVGEPIRVRAGIRTALTGYKFDHFAAIFVLKACEEERIQNLPAYQKQIGLDPHSQLYGSILFQGPRFQRLKTFQYLESDNETAGCTVFTALAKTDDLQLHRLGDPYFRDSLLQSAQVIIPQNQCLPIEIGRLELFRGFRQSCERHIFTDVHKADEKTYLATVSVFDAEGRLLERLVDYRLQFLEKRPQFPKAMDLIASPVLDLIKAEPSLAVASEEGDLLAPYRAIAERLKIDAEPNGPQGQSVFVHRFIPDFKAFANLGRSIYFANFFNWMGNAREMSSLPVLDKLRALTETGRWGQVTNWASIEVFGECRNKDRVVEARLWCGRVTGSKQSSATLAFDWVSKGEDGIEERIASGYMGFTWVEILDHGVVAPAEFPPYYRDFIASMIAKDDRKDSFLPAREPYKNLDKGELLFKVPEGPKSAIRLSEKIFETSLYDSNLVGNLYFGNYSIWMGKIRDHYFRDLAPEYYRGIGEQGELICTKSRIQHLREAMPFDEILVLMNLKALYTQGAELSFEYYKVGEGTHLEKLAIADHTALWTKTGADGEKTGSSWPDLILKALWEKIQAQSESRPEDTAHEKIG